MFFKYFNQRKYRKKADIIVGSIIDSARSAFPKTFQKETENEQERIRKFEIISLYAIVVLWVLSRLNEEGEAVKGLSQAIHDTLFDRFDSALREQGIADIRVGSEIKKLASAFQGRMLRYTDAWTAGDDEGFKQSLLRNNVVQSESEAEDLSVQLYDYIQRVNKNSLEEFFLAFQESDISKPLEKAS